MLRSSPPRLMLLNLLEVWRSMTNHCTVLQVPLGSSCGFDGDCRSALDCLTYTALAALQIDADSCSLCLRSSDRRLLPVRLYLDRS